MVRALINLVFLVVLGYVGWYVYTRLTPEERQKVTQVGKEGVDKVGDAVTTGAKEVIKHIPASKPAPAPK